MRCKLTATSFPWKRNLNTQRRVLRTTIFIHHMRSLDGVVALEFHKCSRCAVVLQAHYSTWKRIIFYVNNQWKTWVSLTSLALFHLFFVKIWRKIVEKPTKWRKSEICRRFQWQSWQEILRTFFESRCWFSNVINRLLHMLFYFLLYVK